MKISFEQLTVSSTVKSLTESKYIAMNKCWARVTVGTAGIRFQLDGSNPTGESGETLAVGDILTLNNLIEIKQFRAIRDGSTDAEMRVHYFES